MLLGHQRVEGGEPLVAGGVEQVAAVDVEQVEEVRRDRRTPGVVLRRAGWRCPGTAIGRPSSSSASASPSRTKRVRRAATRPTSTTSGSRPVMSSRLRVTTRTSSPSRCTWIRMPSSLASIATSAPRRRRPGHRRSDVGRAGGEHRQDRPAHLEPDRRPAPPRPANAAPAAATVLPASIAARRTAVSGTPATCGHRLLDGVERALAEVAGDDGTQPRLLVRGRATEERLDRIAAGLLRPRPGDAPTSPRRPRGPRAPTVTARRPAGGGR